jgi:hypothetical protein
MSGEKAGTGDVRGSGGTRVHGDAPGTAGSAQETQTMVGRDRRDGGGERRMVERDKPRTYYDRPVVKEPIWTWEIPLYFFFGGLAGASSILAYGAERTGNQRLARAAWLNAAVGITASPALLVSDLGKPTRFLNMLRVFKVTSPMSVGSWILAVSGGAIAPATAHSLLGRPKVGRAAKPLAAGLGMPLATYTAALVANSAIPVWSEARMTLPAVFAAGSAASAGAAAIPLTPARHAGPARRLAVGGAAAELVASTLMEKSLGDLGEPYKEGAAGRLAKASKAMTGAGAALIATSGRSRTRSVAGAGLLLAGVVAMRWAVYRAGFQSAADPAYTVGHQRRGSDPHAADGVRPPV